MARGVRRGQGRGSGQRACIGDAGASDAVEPEAAHGYVVSSGANTMPSHAFAQMHTPLDKHAPLGELGVPLVGCHKSKHVTRRVKTVPLGALPALQTGQPCAWVRGMWARLHLDSSLNTFNSSYDARRARWGSANTHAPPQGPNFASRSNERSTLIGSGWSADAPSLYSTAVQ
jgi:hypothetical protein